MLADTSQIDGPTPNNTYGFDITQCHANNANGFNVVSIFQFLLANLMTLLFIQICV